MTQDFKYAIRSMFRSPIFAIGAIATLALGIGVNATIFTLVNGALFSSMRGVAAPRELVWVSGVWRDRGRVGGMSYLEFRDYQDRTAEVFSGLLAYAPSAFSLGSGGEPQRIRGHLVSGSYFTTLRVTAFAGRLLDASDDRPTSTPAAVISYRLWRERFGHSTGFEVPIVVNGRSVIVVGVAPEGFVGPDLSHGADIWLPIAGAPATNATQAASMQLRGTLWLRVIGRLRAGVSIERAQGAVAIVAAALEQEYPATNKNRTAVATSASSGITPSERGELLPIAALLLTLTGLVLLIACANVANLMLARGARRFTEISIRAAIGASRSRIVRQLLTESGTLAALGAAAGLLLSLWASDVLRGGLPGVDFAGLHTTTDIRVIAFTAGIAALTVFVFGLVPAVATTRPALLPKLRETPAAGGGRSRAQGVFVVTQLSLSLVLLLAAGLSLRALQKASAIDLGFNSDRVWTASYDLVLQNYPVERRDVFRRELIARLEAVPGITSATVADLPPLSGTMVSSIATARNDGNGANETRAYLSSVGPNYFTTLEIPIVRGRAIDARDVRGGVQTAVINETLAHRLWQELDPLGRMMTLDERPVQVVGVARDAKYDEPTEDARPFLYLALAQHSEIDRETTIVRTGAGSPFSSAALQTHIHALDPALPIFDVRSLDTVLRDRADKQRGISALFAAFGILALALASLGLYGVMSYAVTRRTREIGVRLALGATPRQLIRLIAEDSFHLTISGVVIGSLLAYPLARVLGALIFGVQIADLATFAAACVLLVAVAMAAALLPAVRAAHLDPVAALRTE